MKLDDGEAANLTELLRRIRGGDAVARERFASLIYDQLKRVARVKMRRERSGHTIQPTELVHEVYLRMFGTTPMEFENRGHFYRMVAVEMRRYLFDYARAHNGPNRRRDLAVSLPEEFLADPETASVGFVLHDLLDRLEEKDPAGAEVVELKFFAGMTNEEIADCLKLPVITVRRRWNNALAFLIRRSKSVQHDN